jgi:hypothetical protein
MSFKQGLMLAGAVGTAVVAAVVGWAYFSASGSGTGTVTVGTASAVELSSDPIGGLLPGAPGTPVTVHVHNPSSGNAFVDQITGVVDDNGGCLGSWFAVTPTAAPGSVPAGATVSTTARIAMLETGTNQDACQGKSLTIRWSTGTGGGSGGGGGGTVLQLQSLVVDAQGLFTVTLDRPAAADTTVQMMSSDPTVVQVPGTVTVPTGFTSVTGQYVRLSAGAADISASLGAVTLSQPVPSG